MELIAFLLVTTLSYLFSQGYGTVTAFIKLEQGSGDTFITKDLTASTGLPWKGGMKGTLMGQVRQVRLCTGSGKYDGLHMMGGAFVDYDRDGLTDLITVGQHASIRSHQMVFNSSKDEKFHFSTKIIQDAHNGGMSEFLRIASFDEHERHANSTCVYLSGEMYSGCGSVRDHIRCYKDGKWETSYPEGESFSSTMANLSIKANGRGKYIIKSSKMVSGAKVGDKYHYVSGAYKEEIALSVSTPKMKSSTLVVKGWACVPNTGWRPRVTISNKSHHSKSGYRKYYQGVVSVYSEKALSVRCMKPGSYPLRFKAKIPKDNLTELSGKLYIQADFYYTDVINTPHVQAVVKY